MKVMLYILLLWFFLVLMNSMHFQIKPKFSSFERERLLKKGDAAAIMEERALEKSMYLRALHKIVISVVVVFFVSLSILVEPGMYGFIIALAGMVFLPVVSSFSSIRRIGSYLENKLSGRLEGLVEVIKPGLSLWRDSNRATSQKINSKAELIEIVNGSQNIMSQAELNRFKSNLKFDDSLVSDVLTPLAKVVAIKRDEVLGPLVLDELYKTGHSRFPVYGQDIHDIVGVLYMRDVMDVGSGQSTAASAMKKNVIKIREDKSLGMALNMFIKRHQHLAVVVNEHSETVGVISLEDVIEKLIGQKIIDEFD